MNIDDIRKIHGVKPKATGKRGRKSTALPTMPKGQDVIYVRTALLGGETPETSYDGNADVELKITKSAACAKGGVSENGKVRKPGVLMVWADENGYDIVSEPGMNLVYLTKR